MVSVLVRARGPDYPTSNAMSAMNFLAFKSAQERTFSLVERQAGAERAIVQLHDGIRTIVYWILDRAAVFKGRMR